MIYILEDITVTDCYDNLIYVMYNSKTREATFYCESFAELIEESTDGNKYSTLKDFKDYNLKENSIRLKVICKFKDIQEFTERFPEKFI